MKKKKTAISSKMKKVSKIKKSISSLAKKPLKKLVVKMTAKAKKPAVKVPTKKPSKNNKLIKAKVKPQIKVSAKPAKPAPKVEKKIEKVSSKGTKKIAVHPQPVAAVSEKAPLSAKSAKAAKVAKVAAKGARSGAQSERMCRELSCENPATTKGYCRLDYIKNWKKIKRKEMILKEGKLNQYIEELVNKYPDKYLDIIRTDLSTEVNFTKVIHDLELDESIDDLDYDGDSIDALIGGIKKDIEDLGEEEF